MKIKIKTSTKNDKWTPKIYPNLTYLIECYVRYYVRNFKYNIMQFKIYKYTYNIIMWDCGSYMLYFAAS